MHLTLYIIRSMPGAGKSTLARQICDLNGQPYDRICENDDFFMVNGEYRWNGDIHYLACKWCEGMSAKNLYHHGFSVVPNVFSRYSSFEEYIIDVAEIGKALKIRPDIIVTEPPDNAKMDEELFFKRNLHKVPREVIRGMMTRWQATDENELEEFVFSLTGGAKEYMPTVRVMNAFLEVQQHLMERALGQKVGVA